MNAPNLKTKIDWRRIVFVASVIAVVAFSAAAFPLVRQALAEHETQRIEVMYATGLSPCEFYPEEIDALLLKYLPAAPTTSITVRPSFSDPVAIRIVDKDLFYFVLDFPLYELGDKPPAKFNSKGVPTIYRSRLSADIARQLPLVLGNDIKHAQAELPLGLDGTMYFFRASPGSCAVAWSPDSDTRAGKFTELFDKLAKRAQTGSAPDPASEQAILATLKSLQSK